MLGRPRSVLVAPFSVFAVLGRPAGPGRPQGSFEMYGESTGKTGEDKMINPAPGFWPIFGPHGAHGGPRELRERPRLEQYCRLHQKSAPEINSKSHSWVLCVFGAGRKTIQI